MQQNTLLLILQPHDITLPTRRTVNSSTAHLSAVIVTSRSLCQVPLPRPLPRCALFQGFGSGFELRSEFTLQLDGHLAGLISKVLRQVSLRWVTIVCTLLTWGT